LTSRTPPGLRSGRVTADGFAGDENPGLEFEMSEWGRETEMAASPRFKVYDEENRYRASTVDPGDAAMIIVGNGGRAGWTIRDGHAKKATVWTEGRDGQAGESYDVVAETAWSRIAARAAAGRR
jgi:hypothetical protein